MDSIDKVIKEFGRNVKRVARRNLQSNKRRTKHKRVNASRALYNSIDYKLPEGGLEFYFQDYGVDVDRGVMGSKRRILKYWNKSIFLPRGKGYQYAIQRGGGGQSKMMRSIKAWINHKSISYSGSIDSAAFRITRNIQQMGTQPTLFFTDAWDQYWDDFDDDLADAWGEDFENKLNE